MASELEARARVINSASLYSAFCVVSLGEEVPNIFRTLLTAAIAIVVSPDAIDLSRVDASKIVVIEFVNGVGQRFPEAPPGLLSVAVLKYYW